MWGSHKDDEYSRRGRTIVVWAEFVEGMGKDCVLRMQRNGWLFIGCGPAAG